MGTNAAGIVNQTDRHGQGRAKEVRLAVRGHLIEHQIPHCLVGGRVATRTAQAQKATDIRDVIVAQRFCSYLSTTTCEFDLSKFMIEAKCW